MSCIASRINIEEPTRPPKDASKEEKNAYKAELARVKTQNANLHSSRCDFLLKLHVAKDFKDKEFYYPFNIDFRGRTYPLPPHLNHIGNDLCRGLMMFGPGRVLGERGVHWLRMQVGNMAGQDKAPLVDRVQWSIDNAEKVEQVGRDPLADKWWLELENPWQFLAAATDLQAALDSGDPENYSSHLAVYQDGSCNGLQHYAALARDAWGGASVNLSKAEVDRPMDVYSDVCDLVRKNVEKEAVQGHEMAPIALPHIVRKVVKQTVMTSVYGVTLIGARSQINRQLVDRGVEDSNKVAMYLAKHTMDAMATMFTNARKVMDFLAECAQIVADCGQPMTWMSPVGIPVLQPYRHAHKYQVATHMQKITLADSNDLLPVSSARQKAAFPPNFVHSLDASHMMYTALACKEKGLTFSSVHDSFWTHAADVDVMSETLREQFVHLYEQPILEDFRESLMLRYPAEFPPVPEQGSFDIKKVMDAPYFFS